MRLHIHAPPAKPHALSLQPKSLLDGRVAGQLDLAAGSQHTLPRQPKSAPQSSRHLTSSPRKSRSPRHSPISRNFPARNRPHRLLNPQPHRSSSVSVLLFLCHPERSRPARPASRPAKSKDPYNRSHMRTRNRPGQGRLLCDVRVGILTKNSPAYAALRKASNAKYSESYTSNTVSSLVICSKSPTRWVRFASLIAPPAL
jgi:hypothetical protein